MPGWSVRGEEELGFYGVEEVRVSIDGGSVTVVPSHAATTCSVARVSGDPVTVHQHGGVLRVHHPAPRFAGWDADDRDEEVHVANVRLAVHPDARVLVTVKGAEVTVDGVRDVHIDRPAQLLRQAG